MNIFPTAQATKEALPSIDDYKQYLISTAIFLVPFVRCLTYWSLDAEWCAERISLGGERETKVLRQPMKQHVWVMELMLSWFGGPWDGD